MFGGLIRSKLYDHQRGNLTFHLGQNKTGDFSHMGTGKTLTAMGKIAHLVAKGEVGKTLIICPMSAIAVWEIELSKHSSLNYVTFKGQLFEKGEMMNKYPAEDVYIISYDALSGRKRTKNILLNALLAFHFDMVVCDEVTFIKNYETLRFKAVKKLCDAAKHTLFLTGTPTDGRPDTVFNIYLAMDGGITFGTSFPKFRNKYYRNVSAGFPVYKIRETMVDELTHKMYLRAVRVRKEDCLTLPPKVFAPRYCELSKSVREVYDPVREELLRRFKIGEHKFRITNPLTKLSKLSQICSGFMYDNRGIAVYTKDNAKVELLREVLEEIGNGEKVIIFTRWREDTKIVSEALKSINRSFRELAGTTTERKEIIKEFQGEASLHTLVSHITVGGYSTTLTAASHVIYFTLNFALTDWLQSQDRIHRDGQKKTCIYIPLLCKDTVDTYIYRALEKKVDLSTQIVDPELVHRI
jgi:SNF2 family DNA or RNA helicase